MNDFHLRFESDPARVNLIFELLIRKHYEYLRAEANYMPASALKLLLALSYCRRITDDPDCEIPGKLLSANAYAQIHDYPETAFSTFMQLYRQLAQHDNNRPCYLFSADDFGGIPDGVLNKSVSEIVKGFAPLNFSPTEMESQDLLASFKLAIDIAADINEPGIRAFQPSSNIRSAMIRILDPELFETLCIVGSGFGSIAIDIIDYLGSNYMQKQMGDFDILWREQYVDFLSVFERDREACSISSHYLRFHHIDNIFHKDFCDTDIEEKHNVIFAFPYDTETATGAKSYSLGNMTFSSEAIRPFIRVMLGCYERLEKDGRMAILLPTDFGLQGGVEKEIRKAIVNLDLLEAVVLVDEALPLQDRTEDAMLIFINKNKQRSEQGSQMVIDARGQSVSALRTMYKERTVRKNCCSPVASDVIRYCGFSLNPSSLLDERHLSINTSFAEVNSQIGADVDRICPLRDYVEKTINAGESQTVEFKESSRWDVKDDRQNPQMEGIILATVASFLNSHNGGTLLIGVKDDRTVAGLRKDFKMCKNNNKDGYEEWLVGYLLNKIGKDVSNCLSVLFADICGSDICIVKVKPCFRPVFIKEQGKESFYVRTGNSKKPLSISETVSYCKDRWKST